MEFLPVFVEIMVQKIYLWLPGWKNIVENAVALIYGDGERLTVGLDSNLENKQNTRGARS